MNKDFVFNKHERRGLFILLGLIFMVQCISVGLNYMKPVSNPVFEITMHEKNEKLSTNTRPKKQSTVVLKKKSQPVDKQNLISPPIVQKLTDAKSKQVTSHSLPKPIKKLPIKMNLNKSDSLQLQQVSGIGPVLSKRIVKYREMIGGFAHLDQLRDVYGIKEESFESIQNQLFVRLEDIKRYNIFDTPVDTLATHFFINPKSAKIIKAYSYSANKNIISPAEILALKGIWKEKIEKAIPYLILERKIPTKDQVAN